MISEANKACPLATEHLAKLRAETLISERTIRKWAMGGAVQPAIRQSLERACVRFRIMFGQSE